MIIFQLIHRASLPLLLLLLLVHQTAAQVVSPVPVFDCTDPNFQVVYTACSANDYSRCCAVGTSCCAGGCCDLLSNCLNVGTKDEVCCSVTDQNFCGYYNGSSTTPPYAVQSVVCTGSSGLSSYFCPPGATCDSAKDSCIGGEGGGGSAVSSAAATSSATESMPISASDELTSLASSTMAAEPSTTAETNTPPTSSSASSTSNTNQAATAAVTSSSSVQTGAAPYNDVIGASVDIFGMWVLVQLFFAGVL